MKINVIKELRIINNIKQESIAKYLNYINVKIDIQK